MAACTSLFIHKQEICLHGDCDMVTINWCFRSRAQSKTMDSTEENYFQTVLFQPTVYVNLFVVDNIDLIFYLITDVIPD